jgi:hypothetical protein
MQRLSFILAGVLAAQLVLALALSLSGSDHASFKAKEPLLAFDANAVDRIDIDESGAGSVTLTKRDGAWAVPSMADFPADGLRVTAFLSRLADLKKGWAAAASAEAAQRFKVSDETHERRIILRKGEKTIAELLLGTSPSFHQVHARSAGEPNIYSIQFANYDVGTRGEDWMNRDVLGVPDDKIAGISIGELRLDRKDGRYVVAGLADGETQKDSEVWRLGGAVTHPAYDSAQGKGAGALAKVNSPDIEVSIRNTDGSTVLLKYKKEAAGGAYLFASSASDYLYRVAETAIQPLLKAKRETLVEAKKHESDGAQATGKQKDTPEAGSSGG